MKNLILILTGWVMIASAYADHVSEPQFEITIRPGADFFEDEEVPMDMETGRIVDYLEESAKSPKNLTEEEASNLLAVISQFPADFDSAELRERLREVLPKLFLGYDSYGGNFEELPVQWQLARESALLAAKVGSADAVKMGMKMIHSHLEHPKRGIKFLVDAMRIVDNYIDNPFTLDEPAMHYFETAIDTWNKVIDIPDLAEKVRAQLKVEDPERYGWLE